MLEADILFTSIGMMAQFLMVWIAWEIRKGRKTVQEQNKLLVEIALKERPKA